MFTFLYFCLVYLRYVGEHEAIVVIIFSLHLLVIHPVDTAGSAGSQERDECVPGFH